MTNCPPGAPAGSLPRHFTFWMLCCWLPAAMPADAAYRYEVTVAESLDHISVQACFEGRPPASLVAESDGAKFYLESAKVGDRILRVESGTISLQGIADGSCVDYRVQLQPLRGSAQTGGPETRWVGGDLLTSIGDWLWRPASNEDGAELVLWFRLPPGISASVPWQHSVGNDGVYRIGATPYNWPGVVAFGRFSEQDIEVGSAKLRVVVLDGPTPVQQQWLRDGVGRAARQATRVHGRFPVASPQVIVAPTSRGRGPVPWAYVSRGGGPAVHLFVVPERGKKAFLEDWSVLHEMSHLFLPYVNARDAWFFEGVPTFLQNVLMARDGAITAEEAWRRLAAGFRRGSRISPGLSLAQASERIGHRGNYLRVYWAGAAVMLSADLRLRSLSSGRQSLDTALETLARCCLDQNRRWSARELVDRLDQETGTRVFSELLREQIEAGDFPDFESLFARAGVNIEDGQVRFAADAPLAAERDALMRQK